MQLSAEQFDKILSSLRSDPPAAAGKEKRRRPRVGLRASVLVIENEHGRGGKKTISTIRDISRDGIGIQYTAEMQVGQRFLVQLPTHGGTFNSILCTVRHFEPVADGCWHVGATFIRLCNTKSAPKAPRAEKEEFAHEADDPTPAPPGEKDQERIRKAILS
jgi:hypothetical protein